MAVALAVHILATTIFLGGLFLSRVVLKPGNRVPELRSEYGLWQGILARYFPWAWISVVLIIASGISMVFLKFGGPSGIPALHRANMVIGIPAILLFVYLLFGPWQRFRRSGSKDWFDAEPTMRRVRLIMTVILTLGLISSAVSAAGRYL